MKTCTVCNKQMEATSFPKNRNKCKPCIKLLLRQWRENNKLKNSEKDFATILKECSNCNEEKNGSEFHQNLGTKDGLMHCCKVCMSFFHKQFNSSSKGAFSMYKSNAKRRNISFELTLTQFENLISSPCRYCATPRSNGVDRLQNNNGYTIENGVSCCMLCNFMKRKLTEEEFLNHVQKIYQNKLLGVE